MFQSKLGMGRGREDNADNGLGIPEGSAQADEMIRHLKPSYERSAAMRSPGDSGLRRPGRAHGDGVLIIGAGVEVKGTISSCDELIVEGTVESTIECRSLVVAETGVVKGEASVRELEIRGRFDGKAQVAEYLTVRASGRLSGSARYGEIEIERGGVVSGDLRTASDTDAARKPAKRPNGAADDTPTATAAE